MAKNSAINWTDHTANFWLCFLRLDFQKTRARAGLAGIIFLRRVFSGQ